MLNYKTLRTKPKELLALTGLARREFEELLPIFATVLQAAKDQVRPKARKRQRAPGGGRKPRLQTVEDKLLFALVYTKTYPLQVVQGQLFEMSQSSANEWIHFLLPVLATALDESGVMPDRDGAQVAQHERRHGEAPDLIVDGVERRRQRPKNPAKQAVHYSGKKKQHADKNVVLVNTLSKRVSFLSPTLPGVVHDKALADWVNIQYPPATTLRSDLGFYGYQPRVHEHLQPKKAQAGGTKAGREAP
jgi:Helix-turn-helix of DDE superfamily endonuclease/DDE superfamily endonuclease